MNIDENDFLETGVQEMTNKCDNIIYSISFISPNYPSNLINAQKENPNRKSILSNIEDDTIYDLNLISKYSINKIMNAKTIKGELCYTVELSNGEFTIIPNNIADRLISDDDMINFLTNKIKTNKNNSIPKLSLNDISNNPHTNFFQLPYSLSKASAIENSSSAVLKQSDFNPSKEDETDKELEMHENKFHLIKETTIEDSKNLNNQNDSNQLKKTRQKTKIPKTNEANQNLSTKTNDIPKNIYQQTKMQTRSKDKSIIPTNTISTGKKSNKNRSKKSK